MIRLRWQILESNGLKPKCCRTYAAPCKVTVAESLNENITEHVRYSLWSSHFRGSNKSARGHGQKVERNIDNHFSSAICPPCFLTIGTSGGSLRVVSRQLFCRSEKESNRLVSRFRFPKLKKESPWARKRVASKEPFFELHNGKIHATLSNISGGKSLLTKNQIKRFSIYQVQTSKFD
jgi:hypothetical protein